MHKRLAVALDDRSYDIIIGSDLLCTIAEHIVPLMATKRAVLVSDDTVAPLYAASVTSSLRSIGVAVDTITVPAGETSKSFELLAILCEQILARAPDRKTTLIALGGGVVGDLAGFAASILLRGMPFIQLPTTLLAQVDSSVGGKTAINTASGKNLVGSFYQPKAVVIDTDTLATLPKRQLLAGYAEIIKYGLIMDAEFYRWCLKNAETLLAGDTALQTEAILASCRMKAQVVAADERESGQRALLNFGHTFGHALEAETGMGDLLLHGEAVAIGMVMACRLSAAMGLIDANVEQELAAHFRAIGMAATLRDVQGAQWDIDRIASHFVHDKKAEAGALTFVVLNALGQAQVAHKVDPAMARSVVASFLQ